MKNLTDEIKLTIELMQGDIDDGAHGELQSHLYSLLEMKRELLGERDHTDMPAQLKVWLGQNGNDRNDAILSTLRGRGLEPVRVRDDVKCKVRFVVDKPLSDDQLRAGGWWCDRTGGNRGALRRKNIDYVECQDTDGCYVFYEASCNSDVKEIIRKGNEFYYV